MMRTLPSMANHSTACLSACPSRLRRSILFERLSPPTGKRQETTMAEKIQRHLAVGMAALAIALPPAAPVMAHALGNTSAGLIDGFLHPPSGLDHLLAMVSVGIWGSQLGTPAIWLLPISFPLIMAFGGALGVIGVPLPA